MHCRDLKSQIVSKFTILVDNFMLASKQTSPTGLATSWRYLTIPVISDSSDTCKCFGTFDNIQCYVTDRSLTFPQSHWSNRLKQTINAFLKRESLLIKSLLNLFIIPFNAILFLITSTKSSTSQFPLGMLFTYQQCVLHSKWLCMYNSK